MNYEVRLRTAAQKQLIALPLKDYLKVYQAIINLEKNPRPPNAKKLVETGLWRIRVGRYRAVYSIDDTSKLINIVRVAQRNEDTYRGL